MISEVSSFFFSISEAVFIFYSSYSRLILDYFHLFFKSTFKVVIGLAVIVALFYLAVTLFALFKRKVNSLTLGAGNEPLVTVQIPTFNELAALNCARRVINFDYPKSKLQIIIGDDSSDNEVSAKINDFALEENFKHPGLVKVTRRGTNQGFKPGNLNHMLRFSKGDFIVIFDSDFLPEGDFLTKTLPHFKDRQVSGVQARWRSVNFDQNIVSILGGSISTLFHHSVLSVINNMGSSSVLCGSAEVVRKRDLLRLGGWVSGSLTEDIEYSFRLIKDGKRIVYLESVECDCEVPFTVKDLCKQ
jgi:cellulose synthase/poly-beta-1,6-N-acetylglucosamine synthase-like glycosyltransferase